MEELKKSIVYRRISCKCEKATNVEILYDSWVLDEDGDKLYGQEVLRCTECDQLQKIDWMR